MSQTIDQRIVQIEFQNKEFEKNVKQSTNSVNELKKALNFDDSTISYEELNDAVEKTDFGPVMSGLKNVSKAFTALEVAGITAIANITNKLTDMALAFVKSATIDQISTGWAKYEEQVNGVQLIMAALKSATSEAVDEAVLFSETVAPALEGLAWYADETSYSFTQMTSAISKFVAQGVDINDAATAVKGISNWTASAGGNAQVAARMYTQLSQSLGRSMNAQDWLSVSNANMATESFKKLAMSIAAAKGELRYDESQDKYFLTSQTSSSLELSAVKVGEAVSSGLEVTVQNFKDMLSKGWLTSDVQIEIYKEYGKFATRLEEINEEIYGKAETWASDEVEYISASKWRKALNLYDEAGIKIDSDIESQEERLALIGEQIRSNKELSSVINEMGITIEAAASYLSELASDEMRFSRDSFYAGQEAKNLSEALNAVKENAATAWEGVFEALFGNYLTSREEFTQLSEDLIEMFVTPIANLKIALTKWAEAGGTQIFISSLENIFQALKTYIIPIQTALDNTFLGDGGKLSIENLNNLANKFKDFTSKLMLSTKAQSALTRLWGIIFKTVDLTFDLLDALSPIFWDLTDVALRLVEAVLEVAGAFMSAFGYIDDSPISDADDEFSLFASTLTALKDIAEGLGLAFKTVFEYIEKIVKAIGNSDAFATAKNLGGGIISGLGTGINAVVNWVASYFRGNKETDEAIENLDDTSNVDEEIEKKIDEKTEQTTKDVEKALKNSEAKAKKNAETLDEVINDTASSFTIQFGQMYTQRSLNDEAPELVEDAIESNEEPIVKDILSEGTKKAKLEWDAIQSTGESIDAVTDDTEAAAKNLDGNLNKIADAVGSAATGMNQFFIDLRSITVAAENTTEAQALAIFGALILTVCKTVLILSVTIAYVLQEVISALTGFKGLLTALGFLLGSVGFGIAAVLLNVGKLILTISDALKGTLTKSSSTIESFSSLLNSFGFIILAFAALLGLFILASKLNVDLAPLERMITKILWFVGIVVGLLAVITAISAIKGKMDVKRYNLSWTKDGLTGGVSDISSPIWDMWPALAAIAGIILSFAALVFVLGKYVNNSNVDAIERILNMIMQFSGLMIVFIGVIAFAMFAIESHITGGDENKQSATNSSKVVESMADMLKGVGYIFVGFAAMIAALALYFSIMGTTDQAVDFLWQFAFVFMTIVGAIGLVLFVMAKFGSQMTKSKGLFGSEKEKMSSTFVQASIAISLIMASMALFIASMAGLAVLIDSLSENGSVGDAMQQIEDLILTVGMVVVSIGLILAAIAALGKKKNEYWTTGKKMNSSDSTWPLLAAAISISLILGSISLFIATIAGLEALLKNCNMSLSDITGFMWSILAMVGAIVGVMVAVYAIVSIINYCTSDTSVNKDNGKSTGIALVALGASIAMVLGSVALFISQLATLAGVIEGLRKVGLEIDFNDISSLLDSVTGFVLAVLFSMAALYVIVAIVNKFTSSGTNGKTSNPAWSLIILAIAFGSVLYIITEFVGRLASMALAVSAVEDITKYDLIAKIGDLVDTVSGLVATVAMSMAILYAAIVGVSNKSGNSSTLSMVGKIVAILAPFVAILAILMGMIEAISAMVIASDGGNVDFGGISNIFFFMSALVGAIAASIYILDKVDSKKMWNIAGVMAAILLASSVIIFALGTFDGISSDTMSNMPSIIRSLAELIGVIAIVALVFAEMAGTVKKDDYLSILLLVGTFSIIAASLAGIIWVIGKIGTLDWGSVTACLVLLGGFIAAMFGVVFAIKLLGAAMENPYVMMAAYIILGVSAAIAAGLFAMIFLVKQLKEFIDVVLSLNKKQTSIGGLGVELALFFTVVGAALMTFASSALFAAAAIPTIATLIAFMAMSTVTLSSISEFVKELGDAIVKIVDAYESYIDIRRQYSQYSLTQFAHEVKNALSTIKSAFSVFDISANKTEALATALDSLSTFMYATLVFDYEKNKGFIQFLSDIAEILKSLDTEQLKALNGMIVLVQTDLSGYNMVGESGMLNSAAGTSGYTGSWVEDAINSIVDSTPNNASSSSSSSSSSYDTTALMSMLNGILNTDLLAGFDLTGSSISNASSAGSSYGSTEISKVQTGNTVQYSYYYDGVVVQITADDIEQAQDAAEALDESIRNKQNASGNH